MLFCVELSITQRHLRRKENKNQFRIRVVGKNAACVKPKVNERNKLKIRWNIHESWRKRNCLVIVLTEARRREKDQVSKNKRERTSEICICRVQTVIEKWEKKKDSKKTCKKLKREKIVVIIFTEGFSVIFLFWKKNCTNTARRLLSFARDLKSWSEVKKFECTENLKSVRRRFCILNTFNCLVDG